MKIDMHVHVTPTEISGQMERYCENEPYFSLLSHTPHNKFATASEVAAHMKETGFDHAVVFGFNFSDMGLCQYVNDYVIEEVKKYEGALIGFCAVPPHHQQAIYEIERCHAKGLKGVGELFPAGQHFDLSSLEEMGAFASCCESLNFPVIIHVNEPVGHYYAGKTNTTLKEVESFILHYPNLKVILAHFGGGLWQYEMMKELRAAFKHVYYDNAASIFLYDPKIYAMIKAAGLLEKFFFGSDFPLLSPKRYEKSINESGLSEEEKAMLMGNNAKKFLESLDIILR